ncbi:CRISPR-associated protein cas2 [Peptoanaerobacter stomatis]|uniref:CRISPR-associated endoribonuclease Cas2 n=1 Tax=Peptoanaerobacter stomatis TaxID=796937 RepID=G9XD55_9FIRM|nr:CRISPR-associated endonuclease Cas2 [Peptoanaerobacter stomatis]EHL19060.1 CRISPR-associated protein cas2 [Peptoanaerobacter stomatis]
MDILEKDFICANKQELFTTIVFYDIISNKRRTELVKILNAFGYRIQKSVFECILTTKKYQLLLKKIKKFSKPEDLIRVYKLNKNVVTTILGKNNDITYIDDIFI